MIGPKTGRQVNEGAKAFKQIIAFLKEHEASRPPRQTPDKRYDIVQLGATASEP
jgi:hypothetical protein